MKKFFIFAAALLLCSASFAAEKFSTVFDLKGADIVKSCAVSGYKKGLVEENGKLFFNSAKIGELGKFRYINLNFQQNISGDIVFTAGYTIKSLVHFNGFEIILNSVEKNAYQVTFRRGMIGGRKEVVSVELLLKGKKVAAKSIPYGKYSGTLEISRSGKKLVCTAIAPNGEKVKVFEYDDFPAGAAKATVKYTSAAQTTSCIELKQVKVECTQKISTAMFPEFAPKKKIADAELFPGKNCVKNPDGTFTVAPGGTLAAVVMGDPHMRSGELVFRSGGKIRLAVFQAGNFEPAVTGEFLVMDENSVGNTLQRRTAGLGGFLLRHHYWRRWDYPLNSVSSCLLFEFSPASDKSITVGSNIELHASVMLPCDVVDAPEYKAAVSANGRVIPAAVGRKITIGSKVLPFVTGREWQAKFTALDLLLDDKAPARTVKLNGKRAEAIELFTAAGKQKNGDRPVTSGVQIVYEDDTTVTNFFTLRWNTGTYSADFMPRGNADFSWWGPVGFPRGELVFIPEGNYGELWNGVYRTVMVNPHPEKKISRITFYKMPKSGSEFLVSGINLLNGSDAMLFSIEPDRSVFVPGKKVAARAFFYSKNHSVLPEGKTLVSYSRDGGKFAAGVMEFTRKGDFSYASTELIVPANSKLAPGPVNLAIHGKKSVLFGVMPEKHGKFHFSMISGTSFTRSDYERMSRIGFDTTKLVTIWDEPEMNKVTFPKSELYLDRIADAGLEFSIRNHIRMMKGPEWFQKKAVFQKRYDVDKNGLGVYPPRMQIDPADEWSVSRFVHLYTETAKFAQKNKAISINANYGLRPEIGIRRVDMGDASLKMFRKLLADKFNVADINKKCKMNYRTFEDFTPLDLYRDKSGFLLKEYAVMHHANLYKAQRRVVEAIRKAGYTGHLTYNVSFHPIEHKLIGSNTGAYLALSREFPPGSLFHETSDRYSLSFVKWLAAKRTFGLPYGDEGCACPPNEIHNKAAFVWMTMMQCFDVITCQWFGGKPGMLEVAGMKALHALVYDAQYLHDNFSLAIAHDSGFDEAHLTIRKGLHERTGAHYGLSSTLRELNLNADRYMIDEFPGYDKCIKGKLIIDDINRSLRSGFISRIDKLMRSGATYLASASTDEINNHAFLKKYGIDPKKVKKGAVVEKKVGKGKLVFRNSLWSTGRWDCGLPAARRKEIFDLITNLGNIKPLVQTSDPILFATPYRAENGDLLIHLVNLRAKAVSGKVFYQSKLASGAAYDHSSGKSVKPTENGIYKAVKVALPAYSSTVLRVGK